MRPLLLSLLIGCLLTTNFIAGCAVSTAASGPKAPQTTAPSATEAAVYSGRISLVVESSTVDAPAQSFAGGFELRGMPTAAQLDVSTPLGQTVAQLSWSPGTAELTANGQTQRYPSAEAMISTLLGVQMPPSLLFDWLAGKATDAALDWQVDLSSHKDGRIAARRSVPTSALLRIILERP